MKRSWKIGIIIACVVLIVGVIVALVAINNGNNKNDNNKDSSSIVQKSDKDENVDNSNDKTEDSKNSGGANSDKNIDSSVNDLKNNGEDNNSKDSGEVTTKDSLTDDKDDNKNNSSKPSKDNNSKVDSKSEVTLTGKEKTFEITLYPDKAPVTCKNFIKLVNQGFYNGLNFTRVIDNFIAQAGDTNGDGTGGSGEKIPGEFSNNGAQNDISHLKGIVSMYRDPSDPNSASSQFFICYNDECKFMDGNYAAFGKVTSGMDIVEDFQTIERETGYDGSVSKPVTPITIVLAETAGEDSNGNPKVKFYVTY